MQELLLTGNAKAQQTEHQFSIAASSNLYHAPSAATPSPPAPSAVDVGAAAAAGATTALAIAAGAAATAPAAVAIVGDVCRRSVGRSSVG